MTRIEPNLLLAIATGIPLLLLTMTATVYGEPGPVWLNPVLAVLYTVIFVGLNKPLSKLMKLNADRPPMISPLAPTSAIWAGIFPTIVTVMAVVPFFIRGFNYGLMVVIGSILLGITIQSALTAREQG